MPCSRMQTNLWKSTVKRKTFDFFLPQNFFSPLDGCRLNLSKFQKPTVKMNIVILKEALSSWMMMIRHCSRVILILLFWGICVHSWDPVLCFFFFWTWGLFPWNIATNITDRPRIKSNSWALPRAKTGIRQRPPWFTISWTNPVKRCSRSSLFSWMWVP